MYPYGVQMQLHSNHFFGAIPFNHCGLDSHSVAALPGKHIF